MNASKHIEYEPVSFSSSTDDSSSASSSLWARSLELHGQTSFRIDGNDGELDHIVRTIGLTSIEDFAIPAEDWQRSKIRSSSNLTLRSKLNWSNSLKEEKESMPDHGRQSGHQVRDRFGINGVTDSVPNMLSEPICSHVTGREIGGIRGDRPPVLKPPPPMTLPLVVENVSSAWQISRHFASNIERNRQGSVNVSHSDEDVQETVERASEKAGDAAEDQDFFTTTSNDDDTSSSTTETMTISPNGRIKRTIRSWQKGGLLGSGSFGSVYEGIAE